MSPRPLFKKVAVVGVGQIGGSLAWAIRKRGLSRRVVGVAKKSHLAAKRIGAIDEGYSADRLPEALSGADLVILALPVALNEAFVRQVAKTRLIGSRTRVIDVGSTKSRICTFAAASPLKNRFVGCHPMAGSEKSGAAFANPDLFQDALCFLTRPDAQVEKLWKGVGSHPFVIGPKAHDAWVAHASHLPHLLAFLLFAGFPKPVGTGKNFQPNPSLKDLARIAQSAPGLWSEIFDSNRGELLRASKNLEARLHKFNRSLQARNFKAIGQLIQESNRRSSKAFPPVKK